MTAPNRNALWAGAFVDELARSGVREVCLSPGSRSTPLVMAAARDPRLRVFTHLDERSAGFFALGIGKAARRPAAVITTSGTATANLFPAVVEASQSESPLLVLTADRPHRLRDSDANQAIDQMKLYGGYVRRFFEAAPPVAEEAALRHLRGLAARAVGAAAGAPAGPVHVNFPFEAPLEPAEVEGDVPPGFDERFPRGAAGRSSGEPFVRVPDVRSAPDPGWLDDLGDRIERAEQGILVAGPSPEPWRVGPAAVRLAADCGFPLLADPLSGARFGPYHGATVLGAYDLYLRDGAVRDHLRPDLVIRVGASPISASLCGFLNESRNALQVVVDEGSRWKDHLAVADVYVAADPVPLLDALAGDAERPGQAWRDRWERAENATLGEVQGRLADPCFEGAVLSTVVESIGDRGWLFVSNSMPIRDLDGYGARREQTIHALGNRGASGIDGIVSTALGVAAATGEQVVAVLGDLALYHDMNGLLATREEGVDAVFVVIHNDGGGIFHMLPIREYEPEFTPYFAAPHGLDFRHAAALYDLPYRTPTGAAELAGALTETREGGGSWLLEVRTDRERNRVCHEEVAAAAARAARDALEEDREE